MISFKIELETPQTFALAESWDELTPAQYHQVIALQLSTPVNPTDTEKEIFYIGMLRMFFQVGKEVFYQLPVMDSIYAEYYHIAMQFLKEPLADKSLLPTLQIGNVEYTGPQRGFTGITLEQMAIAEVLMENYCEQPEESILNQIIAALYYPYSHNEKEIIAAELEKLATAANSLDYALKHAAYLNYRSLRNVVPERCKNLFGGTGGNTKELTEQWEDMFSTLAKDGPHQESEVRATEAIRALRWLNNEYEKVKK